MKNVIISILATIIFYQNFCVMQMPVSIPFIAFTFYLIVELIDNEYKQHIKMKNRYNRLFRQIRRAL